MVQFGIKKDQILSYVRKTGIGHDSIYLAWTCETHTESKSYYGTVY